MSPELIEGAAVVTFPVRFAETDAMGVVHHAAYVVWLEAGRIGWLDAAGVPYAQIAAEGRHFAVTGLQMSYRRSVRFGATVQIATRLAQVRSRQVSFTYAVHECNADGAPGPLLATGVSEHVCVDLEGRVASLPARVLQVLLAVRAQSSDTHTHP
ncbi:MAG: acyl-CoA thioesterase [Caldilineaceae bacterium]